MRLTGLALCLLASSLGARAESLEDRVSVLEQRIKDLEQTLVIQSPQAPVANGNIEIPAQQDAGTPQ
jgi:hypothetical protein